MKFLRDKAHCKHDAKEDFAVITGYTTLAASTGSEDEYYMEQFSINYPEGFNCDNSVLISLGYKWQETSILGYDAYNYGESCGDQNGNPTYKVNAELSKQIGISVYGPQHSNEMYFGYKLVLMKIS